MAEDAPSPPPPVSAETWVGDLDEGTESDSDDNDIVELTDPNEPQPPYVTMQGVGEVNWTPFYESCPVFSTFWMATHDPEQTWPEKVKLFQDRLYHEEK